MNMTLLSKVRDELGSSGTAAVVLLVGAALFFFLVLQPLQQRSARLDEHLVASGGSAADLTADDRLSAFYRFFDRPEQATDWLARLNAIGQAAGLELRSAEYKTLGTNTRIERYEIALPVTGSYRQVRVFLQKAMRDIPVLSLDQVSFKRSQLDESLVDAQLRLTLHMVKP